MLDNNFKAIASFLDTKSYQFTEIDEVYKDLSTIATFFSEILNANGCDIDALRNEFTIVHTHVVQFLSSSSTERCWKRLFQMKNTLGITNVLHIAELSIVIPLSNAESERVYSFMWRVFCKERTGLSHSTLEDILRLRNDNDFSEERYAHAVDLFMSNHTDGTERKRPRRPDGHKYPPQRKSSKKSTPSESLTQSLATLVPDSDDEDTQPETVDDINLSDISSGSSEEDNSSDEESVLV